MHRCARILNSLALTSLLALLLLPPLGASAADQQIRLKSGPLTPEERELTKRFFKMWAARKDGTFANRYLGVVTLQNPLDVWITQEIFFEVKPDFVVETGTFQGGSALLYRP
jgi:cephalosporin hydroxylase